MAAVATGIRDSRASRWLMPVLVGSLALNLIVVGAAFSLLWRGQLNAPEASLVTPPGVAPPSGRRVVANITGYASTLTSERIKELEQLTKAEREKAALLRSAMQAARKDVNKALVAVPFDEARFVKVHARLEEADRRYREASFKLQVALSLHLTADERRDYLRWRETQRLPQNPLDTPQQPPSGEAPPK